MLLAQTGDAVAFEALHERFRPVAVSIAYRMVGSRSIADDIAQEAFFSIWRTRARFDPELGSARTWILQTVKHRAIDAVRKDRVHERRRTSAEALERIQASDQTDAQVAHLEDVRRVRAALGKLPEDQRRAIELAYYGGLSHTEIAAKLDIPFGTVKGRLRLGLGKLRDRLDEPMAA
ncbi:MAG: sigma-70 family RNA polymerase sigma factor [Thermoleophilaceae bacterium]|nr:sigma-70 family RNA polymerase sigma factor [Thermoleophilaceae bacterium]